MLLLVLIIRLNQELKNNNMIDLGVPIVGKVCLLYLSAPGSFVNPRELGYLPAAVEGVG
jgi:hypothetical protein